jgi:hypothetical protein
LSWTNFVQNRTKRLLSEPFPDNLELVYFQKLVAIGLSYGSQGLSDVRVTSGARCRAGANFAAMQKSEVHLADDLIRRQPPYLCDRRPRPCRTI